MTSRLDGIQRESSVWDDWIAVGLALSPPADCRSSFLPSHTAPVLCVLVCCGFASAVSQCGFWWGAHNGIKPCLDVMTVSINVFMELGICTFQVSSTSNVSVLSELILAKGDWSCTKLLPLPQFIQVCKPLKTGFLKWATIYKVLLHCIHKLQTFTCGLIWVWQTCRAQAFTPSRGRREGKQTAGLKRRYADQASKDLLRPWSLPLLLLHSWDTRCLCVQ